LVRFCQGGCLSADHTLSCREIITFSDMAFHYGDDTDRVSAEKLQTRLLQDDSKDSGILNRLVQCMRQFKKHDNKIPKQDGRESRSYAVDMVKLMHVLHRIYERLCKSDVVVHRETNERRAPEGNDESDEEPAGSHESGSHENGDRMKAGAKADSDQEEQDTEQIGQLQVPDNEHEDLKEAGTPAKAPENSLEDELSDHAEDLKGIKAKHTADEEEGETPAGPENPLEDELSDQDQKDVKRKHAADQEQGNTAAAPEHSLEDELSDQDQDQDQKDVNGKQACAHRTMIQLL
jgi:hypothetical protein